jgi:hypothetical protein
VPTADEIEAALQVADPPRTNSRAARMHRVLAAIRQLRE